MAKEKNLTAVTSVAAADFARVVTSAGASVKATFANVAKYIVETYNGSTVAGSAQSVKSALDSLNSNTAQRVSSPAVNVSNIDEALTTGFYRYGSNASGTKPTSGGGVLLVVAFNAIYAQQIALPYAENGSNGVFKRVIYSNTPTSWVNIM